MRFGKTPIYNSHGLVPTPDHHSFSFIYKYTGDGKFYAKYSDGTFQPLNTESEPEVEYYTAGEIINGHRVVMIKNGKAFLFDTSDENNLGRHLGISKNAATINNQVEVVREGIINNPGWGLIQDEVYYVSNNGIISNTIQPNGIFQRVGVAISPNQLKVQFSEPIITI